MQYVYPRSPTVAFVAAIARTSPQQSTQLEAGRVGPSMFEAVHHRRRADEVPHLDVSKAVYPQQLRAGRGGGLVAVTRLEHDVEARQQAVEAVLGPARHGHGVVDDQRT